MKPLSKGKKAHYSNCKDKHPVVESNGGHRKSTEGEGNRYKPTYIISVRIGTKAVKKRRKLIGG